MGVDEKRMPRIGASAPFGRIGRMLGFRWVFFWTMPIPFHPLLLWALLLAPPALIAHRAYEIASGKSGGVTAFGLLLAAGLIAIPMSIPVISWFGLAFRLPLVQALLTAGAMVLIAFEVAAGHSPMWHGVLPAGFALLFLVQRFGGPIYLRRLETENAAFAPIERGQRQVAFEGDTVAGGYGRWLFDHCDVAKAAAIGGGGRSPAKDRRFYRLSPSDFDRIKNLVGTAPPADWTISSDPDKPVAVAPGPLLEPDAIRVRTAPHRAPLWLIDGRRTTLEVDYDGKARRLVGGEAALVGNWPLFVAFYATSITHPHLSRWVIGFARRKPVQLGTTRIYDLIARAFPPRPESGGAVVADASALIHELENAIGEARRDALDALELLIGSIGKDDREHVRAHTLLANPHYAFGQGRRLIDAIRKAAPTDDKQAVRVLAQLLSALPDEEWQELSSEIIDLLNSKRLAFRLLGGDDPSLINAPESVKREHVVMSYELMTYAPRLYERLGELGEPARRLIMGLGELGRWPVPLAKARDQLDRSRSI
jgi:hypothetical protein